MFVPEAPAPETGRSAKRGLLYGHTSLHARDVVKRFRAVAVYEGIVTPVLLAFTAVLLLSWRCAAAAPAAALF